jgi:hypothetical protein
LAVTLAAGEPRAGVNFGYRPGSIAGVAYTDANGNGVRDAGESGLSGVTITLAGAAAATVTTDAAGAYVLPALAGGAYTVAAPATASGLTRSTPSPISVTLAAAENRQNVNFGYATAPSPPIGCFCEKQTVQAELSPVSGSHFPGNKGPDVLVRAHKGESVQAAVDAASDLNADGYIIVAVTAKDGGLLGGAVTQNVSINRTFPKPFALIGCSVTLRDATPGDATPTARITAAASAPADSLGARIFVMDVHADNSNVAGWLVEGNNRYLRNVEARNNQIGVRFVGSANTMHNGAVENNTGAGLVFEGHNNKADSTDAFRNSGHGIQVTGNTNQILKVDAGETNMGNGGDGVHVEGVGNVLTEVDAFANTGDGIEVVAASGAANVIKKARAGDRTKGNGGNGILVAGPGNGATTPIELEENTVKANSLAGIRITGTGHQLKNNVVGGTASGEPNTGCEFQAVAGNLNATGNKANGVTVAGSNGSAFPTTCVGN